jgi:CheY-like chemotaxis protein
MFEQDAPRPLILVVDDEPAIGTLLDVALRRHGFDVLVASGGREALDVYRQHGEAIGVVLLDVRMPGLNGPDTLDLLKQCNPNARCCFMTGDSGEYTEDDLLRRGAAVVFAKPFVVAELARVLRHLLGQPSAPPEAAA